MDALIYEDTPQATYFEGEAVPYESLDQTPPSTPFAPRGLPDLKRRLRKIRRSATSIAPGSAYTDELLERFRYIIVASQLLSDEAGPRLSSPDHEYTTTDLTTLRGAVITAAASFLAAWAIHWFAVRKKVGKPLTWIDVGTYCLGVSLVAVATLFCGRRLYGNYLQRASARTLTKYIDDSHGLDATVSHVMRFIQEVEVVARGYDLGSTLPPITRLEDRQLVRRCQSLRRSLAATLRMLTITLVSAHDVVQSYSDMADVQRYHDIYEVSLVEYTQAVELAKQNSDQEPESLKELRFSIQLHTLARKVLLCDFLALQQTQGWPRLPRWRNLLRILQDVEIETATRHTILSQTLSEEEWGSQEPRRRSASTSSQSEGEGLHDTLTLKTHLYRFDDISHSVRALNAKMHLIREELDGLTNANSEEAVITSTIARHYDSLGSDIRNMLSDWERGKSSILSQMDADLDRRSCSTTSVRTPISPSPPYGSLQIVDGGPADALRLLNGDLPSPADRQAFEEEVFEAVANRLPRKRMSMCAMTREEKIAKLAEDRRKRQTFQEQADNTTSMLRELQMVIKHRPKGSLPAPTTVSNTVSNNRVASL